MEGAGQVFDQLAEVHPAVGGEIKRHLGVVGGVFHLDQLHFQPVPVDALPADAPGLFVLVLALVHPADVHTVGHPHQGGQRIGQQIVGHGPGRPGHLPAGRALGGVGHNVIPRLGRKARGVEIFFFAVLFKTDGDGLLHLIGTSLVNVTCHGRPHRDRHLHSISHFFRLFHPKIFPKRKNRGASPKKSQFGSCKCPGFMYNRGRLSGG